MQIEPKQIDDTKSLIVPGSKKETILFCAYHFIMLAQENINNYGQFSVALSGGSTPKAIFSLITSSPYKEQIDWSKVFLFWSDERSVSPDDPDSNYHMAMHAGFNSVPIPKDHIFRMEAEQNIEQNAKKYENLIEEKLGSDLFDLVMLGMGDDGHTASLFPETEALNIEDRLVVSNHVPQKDTDRMTLTYPCINRSQNICIYVLGSNKQQMVKNILQEKQTYPISKIGSSETKALWILDTDAALMLK